MRIPSLPSIGTALCAALVLGGAPSAAWSQPPGSLDTWVDTCELPNRDLVRLLNKEALIVDAGAVSPSDDAAFYEVAQQPYTQAGIPPFVTDLCTASIFYGQPQVNGVNFRSAVLVGPDLVLTAWHHVVPPLPWPAPPDVRVIFGLQYRQVGESCIPPDFTHVPASQVFRPVEIVGWMYPSPDMMLLRLDRPLGAAPVRVRRSGEGQVGDALTMIAHPDRLATKVDTAGYLAGNATGNGLSAPRVANLHTLVGSSGSMVYNRTERFLETVAAGGVGVGFEPCDGKHKVIHANGANTTNVSVKHFAHFIPAFELLVPLDRTLHVGPVGGVPTNPVFERTIRAPETASGPIGYVITPPTPGPPPVLEISAEVPDQGTLSPGQSFKVTETVDVSGASCGVYERTYSVSDVTHGYTDVVRHVFEIGLREFKVDPPFGSGIADVAAPFEDVVPFTVTNLRPTQYTVQVSADQPWVQLVHPGSDGTVVTLTLPPDGAATVGVTINPLALPPPGPPPHVANLRFAADLGGCPGTAPVNRTFTFNYGQETFTDVPLPPVPIPEGSPLGIWRTIDVGEDFCVGDVDVGVFVDGIPENLVVRLLSPQGELVTLWDHGSLEYGPLWITFDDDGGGFPPVEWLSAIDGESGYGPWRLQVVDDVVDGNLATLNYWSVTVTAGPCS